MRNRIEAAERLGVSAIRIDSTDREAWPVLQERVRSGAVDALLISPERPANDDLRPRRARADRRQSRPARGRRGPLHLRVGTRLPARLSPARGFARACSGDRANPRHDGDGQRRVIADVRDQLGEIEVQRGPLMRQTLALQTMRLPTQAERLAWLGDHVPALEGTGIISTLARRDAEQVAAWLGSRGIAAEAYYGGVERAGFPDPDAARRDLENRLQANRLKALVAATALGMGCDKPDPGFVVHHLAPGSVIACHRQVGRAGRAIGHAVGLMMSGREDGLVQKCFRAAAEMIRTRWRPEPAPAWVTSVPSTRQPTLVAEFARRLPTRLVCRSERRRQGSASTSRRGCSGTASLSAATSTASSRSQARSPRAPCCSSMTSSIRHGR